MMNVKGKRLYRFYVSTHEGDRDRTVLICFADSPDDAMKQGFAHLEERELMKQTAEAYHVPQNDDEDDGEGGYFSCTEIESESDLAAALDGLEGIGDMQWYTGGWASVTMEPLYEAMGRDDEGASENVTPLVKARGPRTAKKAPAKKK